MFQPRFAEMVRNRSKRQTCRPVPKKPIIAGELLSLRKWTGAPYRSKQELLLHATAKTIRPIEIWPVSGRIAIDGKTLGHDALGAFALADGFSAPWDFFSFFRGQYLEDFFQGIVIEW